MTKTSILPFNSRTIKFIGHIETVSPVTVSLPTKSKEHRMPRNSHNSAFIPAHSIRGMLRHVMHFAIAQVLAKQGIILKVDEHYMLGAGIDTAQDLKISGGGFETIGANAGVRQINPAISLFGNFVIASRLKIGSAVSTPGEKNIITIANGSRNHPFNTQHELINYVDESELGYLKDVMQADKLMASEVEDIKAEIKEIEAHNKKATAEEKKENYARLEQLNKLVEEAKDTRVGSREPIRQIFSGVEAIDEGSILSHRMTLTNPTDDEIAFLFWVLSKANVDFNVGGKRNIGCGDIKGEWKITAQSFDHPQPQTIGHLRLDENGFHLEGFEFDFTKFEEKVASGAFDFTKAS